jgi:hypothetical protein
MRESSTSDLACERSLQSTDLVFQVLSLLAQSAFRRSWAYRFDCVADAHDFAFQLITYDRKVWWECAVVVNEENVSKSFCGVATNVLRDNLATDRAPNVIDAVLTTDLFCVIKRYGTVTICDYEDMFSRKDLLCSYKCGSDDVSSLILLEVSTILACKSLTLG